MASVAHSFTEESFRKETWAMLRLSLQCNHIYLLNYYCNFHVIRFICLLNFVLTIGY